MTVILKPDYNMSYQERVAHRQAIINLLYAKASVALNTTDLDVRETVVGGSAVTSAQTGLVPDVDAGGSSSVDLVIEATSTTSIGWYEAAPIANTLHNIVGTTQTVTTANKVFAFYGLFDLSTTGDCNFLQFASNKNIKAAVDTESIYAGTPSGENYVAGHFVNSGDGSPAAVLFGTTLKEPITIAAIWKTAVVKNTALRSLVAEVAGTNITGRTRTQQA